MLNDVDASIFVFVSSLGMLCYFVKYLELEGKIKYSRLFAIAAFVFTVLFIFVATWGAIMFTLHLMTVQEWIMLIVRNLLRLLLFSVLSMIFTVICISQTFSSSLIQKLQHFVLKK